MMYQWYIGTVPYIIVENGISGISVVHHWYQYTIDTVWYIHQISGYTTV